jgi:hypothetical protein
LAAGRGAELSVTYPTVEGDPITDYYRVTPEGHFEVYSDGTEDRYGDGRWSYTDCGRREALRELAC